MLINDEPGNKKFDFNVLDIALWYKVVIRLFTGWGGGKNILYKNYLWLSTRYVDWVMYLQVPVRYLDVISNLL